MLKENCKLNISNRTTEIIIVFCIFSTAILLKLFLLTGLEYGADEAMWGLMAKHISDGTDFPVFFYNSTYMGAIDSYIGAVIFKIFGIGMTQFRMVPLFVTIVFLFCFYILVKNIYTKEIALWSLAAAAIPAYAFAGWSIFCLGGYIWTQLFICCGMLILIIFIKHKFEIPFWKWFILGIIVGFSLYAHYIIAVFWFAASIEIIFRWHKVIIKLKNIIPFFAGWLIGFSGPIIHYLFIMPSLSSIGQINKGIPSYGIGGIFKNIFNYINVVIPKMIGLKPVLYDGSLPNYIIAFVIIFYLYAFINYILNILKISRNHSQSTINESIWGQRTIFAFAIIHSMAYIISDFGSSFTMRYLTPLLIPLSIATGLAFNRLSKIRYSLAIIIYTVLFGFNIFGYIITMEIPQEYVGLFNTDMKNIEEVSKFCDEKQITHIYSDYYFAAPFNFYNREKKLHLLHWDPFVLPIILYMTRLLHQIRMQHMSSIIQTLQQ